MTGRKTSLFPRRNRLTRSSEFARVFEKPRRSSDRCFTVLYRKSRFFWPRLGLAISKKRLNRAVDRNRVKRIVRESFRRHIPELGAKDVVVLARAELRKMENRDLHASLEKHWKQLKLHE